MEKDNASQELQENIKNYMSNNPSEKALLAFEYPDTKLKEGFVVTNQRLVWHYGSFGWCEIPLEEIRDVTIGKSILATVMNVVSFDNEEYPQIYLTGIQEEKEFVIKFRKFVYCIHDALSCNNANQTRTEEAGINYGKENLDVENRTNNNTDFIIRSCNSVKIDSIYCEVGNPTISSHSKKYINAKVYFVIPDDEDIFLIYDETILGNCKKGFALCTNGFYYCKKTNGYISWNEFRNICISKGMGEIKVGTLDFNTSGDSKQLLMILHSIQEFLK